MDANKECILVADDVEFSRGILRMLLRGDYEVLEAADGSEAVTCLKEKADSIICVLLDIKMPGVDGYGVMDYMRRTGILDRIPVIAITSLSDPQGHIRCYESGAMDLIEKPYDEDLLLYKIRWNIARFRRLNGIAGAARPGPAVVSSPLRSVAEHCRRTFDLHSEAEIDGMTASFLRTFGACAERLRAQESNPDFQAVRDITHDLRGFAANSGASDLADLNLVLNVCARAEHAGATSAAIRRIIALYDAYRF
ncbi:MAG: response regulator [Kiritimatiellae bacterium]|nr:response regulator [Kiritimatiellia bacterium]